MTQKHSKTLETALKPVFPDEEAEALARLLESFSPHDTIYYENIDLPAEAKDDCILMAFEERLLIPMASAPGGAWQDRTLGLSPGTLYIMPRVVKALVDKASETGRFDPDRAVRDVLAEKDDNEAVDRLLDFFNRLKPHAVSYKIEAGLLSALNRESGLDLHETIDLFVLVGMMSPCTRGPITSGLSWYEINPALYWGESPGMKK
jgi:hypothetical protein